ncbi:MAG: hypothetical protein HY319_08535 [Armatimonadetes bacterium]|nr:hypothetical protein [Armatimonadota bacterium]
MEDFNGIQDVFVHVLDTGTTSRISVDSSGAEASTGVNGIGPNSVTDDGRLVAFLSTSTSLVADDTNGVADCFLRDRMTGTTTRVSVGATQGNAASNSLPRISGNGRFVAFHSAATNLVAGDTNGFVDVFVRDLVTLATARLTLNGATQADGDSLDPCLSGTGAPAVFESPAYPLFPWGCPRWVRTQSRPTAAPSISRRPSH